MRYQLSHKYESILQGFKNLYILCQTVTDVEPAFEKISDTDINVYLYVSVLEHELCQTDLVTIFLTKYIGAQFFLFWGQMGKKC